MKEMHKHTTLKTIIVVIVLIGIVLLITWLTGGIGDLQGKRSYKKASPESQEFADFFRSNGSAGAGQTQEELADFFAGNEGIETMTPDEQEAASREFTEFFTEEVN